jgi:hypothetical protein
MLVRLCNGVVAIVLLTFSTVGMLAPIEGAKGLYYGMPEEILQGSDAAAQFGRHCVAVIGALQFGAAASLLLSTGATTPEAQKNAAVGALCGCAAHVAVCLRLKAFDGQVVDPLSMPTGLLLGCITMLGLGLVVEADTTEVERYTAIRTAEQKEFKGDMMENREYVEQLTAAGLRGKPKSKKAD